MLCWPSENYTYFQAYLSPVMFYLFWLVPKVSDKREAIEIK